MPPLPGGDKESVQESTDEQAQDDVHQVFARRQASEALARSGLDEDVGDGDRSIRYEQRNEQRVVASMKSKVGDAGQLQHIDDSASDVNPGFGARLASLAQVAAVPVKEEDVEASEQADDQKKNAGGEHARFDCNRKATARRAARHPASPAGGAAPRAQSRRRPLGGHLPVHVVDTSPRPRRSDALESALFSELIV